MHQARSVAQPPRSTPELQQRTRDHSWPRLRAGLPQHEVWVRGNKSAFCRQTVRGVWALPVTWLGRLSEPQGVGFGNVAEVGKVHPEIAAELVGSGPCLKERYHRPKGLLTATRASSSRIGSSTPTKRNAMRRGHSLRIEAEMELGVWLRSLFPRPRVSNRQPLTQNPLVPNAQVPYR